MAPTIYTEVWTLYGIGMLIFILRIAVRCRMVGFKWNGDDYFAVVGMLLYSAWEAVLVKIQDYGNIRSISLAEAATISHSSEKYQRIVLGSKLIFVSWNIYVTFIWSMKACMLFFLSRLTNQLAERKLVQLCGLFCGVGYFVTMMVVWTQCTPISRQWQVYPYPGDACALKQANFLALVVTNVTTDATILYIPLPLLWRARISVTRKCLYTAFMSTGVFIIIATILRCYYTVGDLKSGNAAQLWAGRELFVGIIAVNIPILQTYVTRFIRILSGSSKPRSSDYNKYGHNFQPSHELPSFSKSNRQSRSHKTFTSLGMKKPSATLSEEHIVEMESGYKSNVGVSGASIEASDEEREIVGKEDGGVVRKGSVGLGEIRVEQRIEISRE